MINKVVGVRCLAILLAIGCIFFVYKPGLGGALFYDDYGNLEGLGRVTDIASAKQYIFSGFAGPLGRPIALASFAAQAEGWPGNSRDLLLVNVSIHIVNGLLVGLLGYLCVRLSFPCSRSSAFWTAFLSALLWASLPLLASTSLIAVQRMTGLAAVFSLLGLIGYVWAYRLYVPSVYKAFFIQMTLLGCGTAFAMLAKENGALTPLYALAITLIVRDEKGGTQAHWIENLRLGILILALIVFLIYLSPFGRDFYTVSDVRGYSSWQRLQIEMIVLWDYLRAFIAPMPSMFGPFHDDYTRAVGGVKLAFAVTCWLIFFAGALWLFFRGHTRWVLFALLWFLFGHLLESTSVLLELYFEHRNYLPVYGACLAIAVAVMNTPIKYRRIAVMGFLIFWLFQLLVLFSVTSVWGDRQKSADLWAAERPASSRAVTHAVFLDLSGNMTESAELNYKYISRQRYEYALKLLDRTIDHCAGCVSVHLQAVAYACRLGEYDEARERLERSLLFAAGAEKPRAVVDGLFGLREIIKKGECGNLEGQDLLDLIDALSESQLFEINHISTRIYFLAAAVSEDIGEIKQRDEYLVKAEAVSPAALPVLQYQVESAVAVGAFSSALEAIDRRYPYVGLNTGAMTKAVLDDMRERVLIETLQPERENLESYDE